MVGEYYNIGLYCAYHTHANLNTFFLLKIRWKKSLIFVNIFMTMKWHTWVVGSRHWWYFDNYSSRIDWSCSLPAFSLACMLFLLSKVMIMLNMFSFVSNKGETWEVFIFVYHSRSHSNNAGDVCTSDYHNGSLIVLIPSPIFVNPFQ